MVSSLCTVMRFIRILLMCLYGVCLRYAVVSSVFFNDFGDQFSLKTLPGDIYVEETYSNYQTQQKRSPWPLVRERTIPAERPPLVDKI
jgi:hypothetical protein